MISALKALQHVLLPYQQQMLKRHESRNAQRLRELTFERI